MGAGGPQLVTGRCAASQTSTVSRIVTSACGYPLLQDDASLVAAVKSGDREAFEILVERHGPMVFFTALRITDNREDAEDVVQQCFEKAFVHLTQFEERSSFSTWLTRIAINEALMSRRDGRRSREMSINQVRIYDKTPLIMEIPDSGPNPEDIYLQHEDQRLLLLAIDQLKPRIRTALRLCRINEQSVSETARILGVSTSATKSRISRGFRTLREKLGRSGRGQVQMNQHDPQRQIIRSRAQSNDQTSKQGQKCDHELSG